MTRLFKRALFISCAVLALSAASAHAQGEFVTRGAPGFLLGGDMAAVDGQSTYAAKIGYSFKGTVDVGMAYNWIESEADTLGWNINGRSLEPSLALHIIKQGTSFPLSLSALGSFAFQGLDPDADSGQDAEIDGRAWSIGGTLHSVFAIADFVGLRPYTSIVYINRTHDYTFSGDESTLTIESDDTRFTFGLQMIVMPTARSVMFAGPKLSYMGGDRFFGVTAGVVFN